MPMNDILDSVSVLNYSSNLGWFSVDAAYP